MNRRQPEVTMQRNTRLVVYVVPYILLATLQYSFAKDGLRFSDPAPFMAMRYSIASVATFAISGRLRPILNRDTFLLGVFTWLSTVFWIFGLQLVSPAESAVLSFTMPFFAIPLSAFILKERTSRLGWLGAVVGFAGVTIYGFALGDSGGTLVGAIFTITNAFFWALYTVFFRKVRNQDAASTVATQFLIGAVLFWILTPTGSAVTFTPEFVFDLAYVSLLSGVVMFFLWEALTRIEKIGRLTTLTFATPGAAMLVQAVETRIAPGLISLAGVGLMFLGIYISRARNEDKLRRTGKEVSTESSGVS